MYKLLFDSDALIKLAKIQLLDIAALNLEIAITEEVYAETVEEGKKNIYPDAEKIEGLIDNGIIKVIKRSNYKTNKQPERNLGKGEVSIYQARKKNYLIVTDDLSFTLYLQNEEISCISSAHLLPVCIRKKFLKIEEAYEYLERLRPFIRREIYDLIKTDIKGE